MRVRRTIGSAMAREQHQQREHQERHPLHDDARLHEPVRAPRIAAADHRHHTHAEDAQDAEHREHEKQREECRHRRYMIAAAAAVIIGRGEAVDEVIILERADTIGSETSSRNSEVIHGGLYYPAGSLKATSCVAGRERLYAYCREHGVPHARLGKLIVATAEAEIPGVEKIEAAARANGVANLEWLSASEARRLEPELNC